MTVTDKIKNCNQISKRVDRRSSILTRARSLEVVEAERTLVSEPRRFSKAFKANC